MKKFKIYWYYFWGNLLGKVVFDFDLGCLYPLYNKWMTISADLDDEEYIWKIR